MLNERVSEINSLLSEMGGLVEDAIVKAIRTMVEKDPTDADQIIEDLEPRINELEKRIDEECLITLARYQPVAHDLRRVVAVLKIDKDLERMGDHCENIARRAKEIIKEPLLKPLIDLPRMAETAQEITKEALDSFFKEDTHLARQAIEKDVLVDQLQEQIIRELMSYILADPRNINKALDLIFTSKDLERISDLATNIAEETFFLVEGSDIRHMGPKDQRKE
ncbi:MAG TPA: phosphate signaling complex protein PhoU [Coprothermobacter proteolyticus]|mgnify:FL=1|uniref:Phosphate-specific transport system accessory protein PhoU n=1 Tax=Coprothermobacter proteolyticus (strain ATCC 35245 / DSM 5265 / OCM 4 / BT) TaxID=309798 RepID=B5Y9L6_COPPD|nr:phosphate signaling complex protein PhoU [Coprothermobacter proteolyticus]MBK6586267.1 phosphate signaling complex protein PhoU [Coprothermobacter sp.]ACI17915.1 phosphate transporter regulatory protein PhoU [Coprothermobacter proteolyticus DSM 5265]MBP8983591.1 phosphate signaling complex protein PhoU [Coprothermobacter sp.]NLT83651.1 phosphate signaling complex protein PhoU [Coprothermobacter proteolyticus]HOK24426.1 phosphate signaling complex protein PhoU [Coprothermobacter proteolyticu